jgi:RND family efflux transporter MFP subunit
VDLASQLEARLKLLRVRPGDRVAEGEVIAQLDTHAARKELAMAKAAVLAAKAEAQRAELELQQATERRERRAATVDLPSGATVATVSEEDRSNAAYQEKLAAARLEAAKAAVIDRQAHADELRTLAEEGAVRAPFDAIVAQRYLDEGTIVRKGTPLVRLIESSALRVRFAVPEDDVHAIEVGVPLRVRVDKLDLNGKVEKVAPEIDAAARMIFVDASLDVPVKDKPHVRSGQVARVFVAKAEQAQR